MTLNGPTGKILTYLAVTPTTVAIIVTRPYISICEKSLGSQCDKNCESYSFVVFLIKHNLYVFYSSLRSQPWRGFTNALELVVMGDHVF